MSIQLTSLEPSFQIVQLPFPSTHESHPLVSAYYKDYDLLYRKLIPMYFTPKSGLWEIPLWVAHLSGLLKRAGCDAHLIDLSGLKFDSSVCAAELISRTSSNDVLLFSPLAQNYQLFLEVSHAMRREKRKVIVGGNMAELVKGDEADTKIIGIPDQDIFRRYLGGHREKIVVGQRNSRDMVTWRPDYRLLEKYHGQVPLLRLNASHGCLFQCTFCGDAWSNSLMVVDRATLEEEVADLRSYFPSARLIYIGDKTFGQSKKAVNNLVSVFRESHDFKFIVQTHVLQVTDALIEKMVELGVVLVEMGFESGDTKMLKSMKKRSKSTDYYMQTIDKIRSAGINISLNVMGGLPDETEDSHMETLKFLKSSVDVVSLYNLYNFVPYPLVPDYDRIKQRIVNWNYNEWREDAPVIFDPYFLTRERSWDLYLEKVSVCRDLVRQSLAQLP